MAKKSESMSRRTTDGLLARGLAERIVAQNAPSGIAPACLDALTDAVAVARDHARAMVLELGEPVFLDTSLRPADAFGPVSFGSTAEALATLQRAARIRDFFSASPTSRCVFLMTMLRHEYEIMGSELEGEMIKRGVLQKVVEFREHHVPFVAPTLAKLQDMLIENTVLYLAGIVPGRIRASQSLRAEILHSEELLKAQIHTLEHARLEFRPFAVPRELRARLAQGEAEVAEFEKRLAALPKTPDSSDCLREVREVLRAPAEHIRLEQQELRVGDFGIKSDAGRPIRFRECLHGDGQRLTVLLSGMTRDIARRIWPDLA